MVGGKANMRIAQILNSKAHWIFEDKTIPDFPPDVSGNPIVLIDITDKPEVREGWEYDEVNGEFTEPVYIELEPAEIQVTTDEMINSNYLETQYQTVLIEMMSGF